MIFVSLLLAALTGVEAFKPSGNPTPPLQKPFDQKFADRYSPLKYLGGLGPYSSRQGNGISPETPEGCEVDQVVLLQRHGERYPDASSVNAHEAVLQKIHGSHPEAFTGDLEFLNSWTYFLDSEGDAGLEIASGPYAGLTDLYEKGAQFRGRYGDLWDGQSHVPLFVSASERVLQSARHFGEGFFGYNYTDVAEVNIISESPKAGGNAISPYFCDTPETTECEVPQRGTLDGVYDIVYPEFDVAALRLNEEHGLSLTGTDVGYLFEIGAFDVSSQGTSPWLDVFTREEWLAYAYRQGLWFHCYFGAGSASGRAAGANWANATSTLLNQGPDGSGLPLALTFGHDSDITSFLGGIGALSPLKPLDPTSVTFDTRWDIDDIIPMGAQLVIERLRCKAPGLTNSTNLVSANGSLPDALLNQTYGTPNAAAGTDGYFDPNYKNGTTTNVYEVPLNSSSGIKNQTVASSPYLNYTVTVHNGTKIGNESTVVVTNTTSQYGFNLTDGTTNGAPTEESVFVRVVLNDAVVPLDFCYDGPGYSCSLENYSAHVAEKVQENNFEQTCHATENGVPASIDFYWNYNKTTAQDTASYIPWQGNPIV